MYIIDVYSLTSLGKMHRLGGGIRYKESHITSSLGVVGGIGTAKDASEDLLWPVLGPPLLGPSIALGGSRSLRLDCLTSLAPKLAVVTLFWRRRGDPDGDLGEQRGDLASLQGLFW